MAEINLFHFRKGNSAAHMLDPRTKFFLLMMFSISVLRSSALYLAVLTAGIIISAVYITSKTDGPGFISILWSMKVFLLLYAVIILVRTLNTGGIKIWGVFSIEGLAKGSRFAWQLSVLLIFSNLFAICTDPQKLHEGIYLILKPLPLIPAGKIASVISLTILFIPLIFDQYREVRAAYLSRLGNLNKNPFIKINALTLPLLESILTRADETANAMESRCWKDSPGYIDLKLELRDFLTSIIGMIIFAGSFLL